MIPCVRGSVTHPVTATFALVLALLLAGCASATPPANSTAAPATIAIDEGGGATQLQADPAVSGDRMFTLNQAAEIEDETTLEILEGWADPAAPDGQARYTFLVRFNYPVPESPDPFGVNAGYYNAAGFSVRDVEGFEYDVVQGSSESREPELLFGNLTEGQAVQGWVTFEAPADTSYIDLVYSPVSREPATFRALVP
jgi:hypothetical protein